MIKTIPEVELMRVAARANEQALLAAGDSLRDGAEWSEIETACMTEMARQGARGVYCITSGGHELLTTAGLDLRCVPG